MSFSFQDSTARTAWGNATSQTGQLTAFAALWSGDVAVRYYTSGGTHLGTATHSGWDAIDTSGARYSIALNVISGWTPSATGTATYCVLSIPGGADKVRAVLDAPIAVIANSRVNLDDGAGGAGIVLLADAGLPLADMPVWVASIVADNTLYEVGKTWDDATDGFNAKLAFPEVTNGGGLYAGSDGAYSPFHDAYGGAVFVPDIGAHGAMVFGGTGEGTIVEQQSYWSISDDNPVWGVFQQPSYTQSASAATAAGASWYYNPTEYAALDAAKKIPWSAGTGSPEGTWGTTWDKTFPVGRAGWIIPGKTGVSELGGNRPMAFRYNYPVYIPASMTGWGAGAILINARSFHGSFGGDGGPPLHVTPAEWYSDVWPSGRVKRFFYAMNVVTKAWAVIGAVPDFENSYSGNVTQPHAFVDTAAKRVYYTADYGGDQCLYYADFASGADAMTTGGPSALVEMSGDGGFSQSQSSSEMFIGTAGSLAGKKLWYFKNGFGRLGLIDVGENTIYDLDVTSPPPAGTWRFSTDQQNARIFISVVDFSGNTVTSTKFSIPDTPATAASYSLSTTSVSMNGVTMESATQGYAYGERAKYISSLGGVILINQRFGKVLAYRPA